MSTNAEGANFKLPMFFAYEEEVRTNSYVATVKVLGRALVSLGQDEDDKGMVWFHGVNPAGISACGSMNDERDAPQAFRRAFRSALLDMADEAKTGQEFTKAVVAFFRNTHASVIAEWDGAVQMVRESKLGEEPGMRKVSPVTEPDVEVEYKEIKQPKTSPTWQPVWAHTLAANTELAAAA